jgi:hypothetical protein
MTTQPNQPQGDFPKGGRPMVAGQPATDRIMSALDNRITGEPKPTRKQVAMVLHAMADHTAIMQMVNYDMRDLHPNRDKKTEYWPVETSIGRWFHVVAGELEDAQPTPATGGEGELREQLRKVVVEPTGNQISTADIAVGFRSGTDVNTIVSKLEKLFESYAQARADEIVGEGRDEELVLACREWEKNPNTPATYLIDRRAQLTKKEGQNDR